MVVVVVVVVVGGGVGFLTISLLEVLATEEDTIDLLPDWTKQVSRERELTTHLILKGYTYLHLSLSIKYINQSSKLKCLRNTIRIVVQVH